MSFNWLPETFEEFHSEALAGRVGLSIMNTQYNWLYENILPNRTRFIFWSEPHYEEKLLCKMISNEATFRAVHDKGIDLILYEEANEDRRQLIKKLKNSGY